MTWKYSLVIAGLRDKKKLSHMRDKKHVIPWDTRDKFIPLRPYPPVCNDQKEKKKEHNIAETKR